MQIQAPPQNCLPPCARYWRGKVDEGALPLLAPRLMEENRVDQRRTLANPNSCRERAHGNGDVNRLQMRLHREDMARYPWGLRAKTR